MKLAILFLLCAQIATSGEVPVVKQTESLVDGLTAKNKVDNWPTIGALNKWSISVDTFTHEVPSSTIQSLYERTCKKLHDLYGDEVATYRWSDLMGYPGQVTIVQFVNEARGNSYLISSVFEANDNDNYRFSYVDGTYDTSKMEKRPDFKLGNILRCNHRKEDWRKTETAPSKLGSVKIKVTRIECGSRTDEVDFEWIHSPTVGLRRP